MIPLPRGATKGVLRSKWCFKEQVGNLAVLSRLTTKHYTTGQYLMDASRPFVPDEDGWCARKSFNPPPSLGWHHFPAVTRDEKFVTRDS